MGEDATLQIVVKFALHIVGQAFGIGVVVERGKKRLQMCRNHVVEHGAAWIPGFVGGNSWRHESTHVQHCGYRDDRKCHRLYCAYEHCSRKNNAGGQERQSGTRRLAASSAVRLPLGCGGATFQSPRGASQRAQAATAPCAGLSGIYCPYMRQLAMRGGPYTLDERDARDMARTYPLLQPLHELRVTIGQMRLENLAVGSDGRNRTLLSPFRACTSRNQPSAARFIFAPSVWIRGLIRPQPGRGIAYVDWSQQEFGIACSGGAGSISHMQ